MTVAQTMLLATLALLLLAAAVGDLRTRTIPNRLTLAIAVAAPLSWLAQGIGWGDAGYHLVAATIMLVGFGALFAAGMMGGGDVKLIAALALWLPARELLAMLVWMALAGGALTVAMLVRHRLIGRAGQPEVPYGVAIAAGALTAVANLILTRSIA